VRQFGLDVPGVRAGTGRAQPERAATVPLGDPGEGVGGQYALVSLPVTAHAYDGHLVNHKLNVRYELLAERLDRPMLIIAC
jgi:hypothetical protein